MKVSAYAQIRPVPEGGGFGVRPTRYEDFVRVFARIQKLVEKGKHPLVRVTVEVENEKRSHQQLNSVWALVTLWFWSQEGRNPNEQEKTAAYEDFKEAFAPRVPSRLRPEGTRPKGLSEMTQEEAAAFIGELLSEVSEVSSWLQKDQQAEVRSVFEAWQAWRSTLDRDPLDQSDTEKEWRRRHPVCDACGIKKPGLQIAHIVSRGADPVHQKSPWNWLHLCPEDHGGFQHQKGWESFLEKYPHLRGRVEKARILASATQESPEESGWAASTEHQAPAWPGSRPGVV